MNKEYLGDSVYATWTDSMVTLTVENGFGPSATIHLEPAVYAALVEFVSRGPIQLCEHGIRDGEFCELCNREYKRAAAVNGE